MEGLSEQKKIEEALLKRATGYEVSEVTEEQVADETGCLNISKKRITRKHISPDITALKLWLETKSENDLVEMNEEELLKKRDELLYELKNRGNEDGVDRV